MRKLLRHRSLILGCAAAFTVLAAAVTYMLPTRYIAEARVLVGVPEPRVMNIESIISDVSPDAERVQNESFVIQSRDLAKDVIAELHLADNPEFNPALAPKRSWRELVFAMVPFDRYIPEDWSRWFERSTASAPAEDAAKTAARQEDRIIDTLLDKVSVTTLGRSHVLSIQASAATPDEASSIANSLAKTYLAHQRNDKINATTEAENFLANRIADLRQQVQKAEQAVEDYRKENNLYQGATTGVTSQQLTELNTQLIIAETNKAEADARVNEAVSMRQQGLSSDSVPDVLRSGLIQNLKTQQAQAQQKVAQLSSSYGNQHPAMIDARAEVADIQRKIATEIAHTVDGLRREARAADARYGALKRSFAALQSQMGNVNEKSIHLAALEREATVNRNLLENVLNRSKETIGQQELQQPNAKLISPAAPPAAPGFPPKTLIVFLGTLGGSLAGVIMALLRESVDRTFRRGDQIEAATGLPLLAMVPGVTASGSPAMHVLRKPVSPYSEALRKLYIGLELSEAATSPKTVLFCSATPGEGKSVMVASLGRMLASNGRRILLIDCDWRCPSLHRLFQCPNRGGLAAMLSNHEVNLNEIIHSDELSGVDVIVAGDWTPKSMHLLLSDRMRIMLQAFAKNYDMVILDSPPILVGAEVLPLSRLVDKVVFAVRWGWTRREIALDALKHLIEAQADVAGTVLSRVDAKRYRQYGYGHLDYEYARGALARLT